MTIAQTDQIARNMQLKTTEELLDIWSCNDRGEWSDSAFNAISQTLSGRGVVVPQQRVSLPPPARSKWGKGLFFMILVAVMVSKTLSTLTFGGVFPAAQGRKTYEAVAALWGNQYAARLAGNRAAVLYVAVYLFIMLIYLAVAKLIGVVRQPRKSQER